MKHRLPLLLALLLVVSPALGLGAPAVAVTPARTTAATLLPPAAEILRNDAARRRPRHLHRHVGDG